MMSDSNNRARNSYARKVLTRAKRGLFDTCYCVGNRYVRKTPAIVKRAKTDNLNVIRYNARLAADYKLFVRPFYHAIILTVIFGVLAVDGYFLEIETTVKGAPVDRDKTFRHGYALYKTAKFKAIHPFPRVRSNTGDVVGNDDLCAAPPVRTKAIVVNDKGRVVNRKIAVRAVNHAVAIALVPIDVFVDSVPLPLCSVIGKVCLPAAANERAVGDSFDILRYNAVFDDGYKRLATPFYNAIALGVVLPVLTVYGYAFELAAHIKSQTVDMLNAFRYGNAPYANARANDIGKSRVTSPVPVRDGGNFGNTVRNNHVASLALVFYKNGAVYFKVLRN